jgi:hypothetical protein
VQTALSALLVLVLVAAVISFAVMGLWHSRRARRTARLAAEMGLRFDQSDPFDVPGRYAAFALISGGHSPCVGNVVHGRLSGRQVRAFDFRYEIGHGTRRVGRHYGVVVMQAPGAPEMLAWHQDDLDLAPLAARQARTRVAQWVCGGDMAASQRLTEGAGVLGELHASLQTIGELAMVCVPIGRRLDYVRRLGELAACVQRLTRPGASEDVAIDHPGCYKA